MKKNIKRYAIILLLCCMMTACKMKETKQNDNDMEVIDTQPEVTQNENSMDKEPSPGIDGLINSDAERLPDNSLYVAASYIENDGFDIGTVTIYKDQWRKVKVFQNAHVSGDIGLLPDETPLGIGLAVKQEDGTWNMRYGLYSLQEDAFILPNIYESLRVLDAERGFLIVGNTEEYQVINQKGEVLASGFYEEDGLGLYKRGNYYWNSKSSKEKDAGATDIYDINFCFIKQIHNKPGELYNADGTLYFSEQMFFNNNNIKSDPKEVLAFNIYDMDNKLISVDYKDKAYVLDQNFNIITSKDRGDNIDSYYYWYGEVYSDTVLNKDYIEHNTFYDKGGNRITNKDGNDYTDIVYRNYWENREDIILYSKQDNKLNIMKYHTNEQYELDISDWDKVCVKYMHGNISVVQQVNGDKTKIYNKETLLLTLDGLYEPSPLLDRNKAEGILLVDYGANLHSNQYILLNKSGNVSYQSSGREEILSIDASYIQVDRGNYDGVMDYSGKYLLYTDK
ncbi:MAG: hypothetical protein E7255_15305 [Lachnospiraceae bacterium]|nr:hypothetical protein [Lachnospiraceae bacterium]